MFFQSLIYMYTLMKPAHTRALTPHMHTHLQTLIARFIHVPGYDLAMLIFTCIHIQTYEHMHMCSHMQTVLTIFISHAFIKHDNVLVRKNSCGVWWVQ